MKVGDTVYVTSQYLLAKVGDAGKVVGFYRRETDPAIAVAFSFATYAIPVRCLAASDVSGSAAA